MLFQKQLAPIDEFLKNASILSPYWAIENEQNTAETIVEIVSKYEIYLMVPTSKDDPTMIRFGRICGQPRFKDRYQLRCRLPAGFGTHQVGFGRCCYHRGSSNLPSYANLMKLADKGVALTISEIHSVVPELLNDSALSELHEEIAILRYLLHSNLNRDQKSVNIPNILELIKNIIAAKQAKSRIENDRLMIDIKAIDLFVSSLIDILANRLGRAEFSDIMHDIKNNLKFPANKAIQNLMAKENMIPSTKLLEDTYE